VGPSRSVLSTQPSGAPHVRATERCIWFERSFRRRCRLVGGKIRRSVKMVSKLGSKGIGRAPASLTKWTPSAPFIQKATISSGGSLTRIDHASKAASARWPNRQGVVRKSRWRLGPTNIRDSSCQPIARLGERTGIPSFRGAVTLRPPLKDLPDASFAGQQETSSIVRGRRRCCRPGRRCLPRCLTDRGDH